jgi:tRNA-dihydrouridine synthase A
MRGMTSEAYKLCVAPMMERTDRHFRYLMRLLAPHARLYTEMVTARALLHGNARRLLAYDPAEHPVALQLGGGDPAELAAAAQLGAAAGYDEINLNVGCPSGRVQAGCFGAALMLEPERVARCVSAISEVVAVPVTVKTRLGVDDRDSYELLHAFVRQLAAAGCRTVLLHARKAWLKGLSPKENRDVPPLDYARVHRVKRDFPELNVVINGGLTDTAGTLAQLSGVDGVMLGRAAYHDPMLVAELDRRLFAPAAARRSRREALAAFCDYATRESAAGTPLRVLTRHLHGLYAGQAGGRRWRRELGLLPNDASGVAALRKLAAEQQEAHAALEACAA